MSKKDDKIEELTEEVAFLTTEIKKLAERMRTIRGEYATMKLWMVRTKPYGLMDVTLYTLFKDSIK